MNDVVSKWVVALACVRTDDDGAIKGDKLRPGDRLGRVWVGGGPIAIKEVLPDGETVIGQSCGRVMIGRGRRPAVTYRWTCGDTTWTAP
jgi:hypothetical protein